MLQGIPTAVPSCRKDKSWPFGKLHSISENLFLEWVVVNTRIVFPQAGTCSNLGPSLLSAKNEKQLCKAGRGHSIQVISLPTTMYMLTTALFWRQGQESKGKADVEKH